MPEGGAAGFALGGPPGAIIGAVAGHRVDKMRAALTLGQPTPPGEVRQDRV